MRHNHVMKYLVSALFTLSSAQALANGSALSFKLLLNPFSFGRLDVDFGQRSSCKKSPFSNGFTETCQLTNAKISLSDEKGEGDLEGSLSNLSAISVNFSDRSTIETTYTGTYKIGDHTQSVVININEDSLLGVTGGTLSLGRHQEYAIIPVKN